MKQSTFVIVLIIAAFAVALAIYLFVLGNPANFKDGEGRQKPDNIMGQVYTGGPIVPVLISLSIMVITFIVERLLSLRKAQGRGSLTTFLKNIQRSLANNDVQAAIGAFDPQ